MIIYSDFGVELVELTADKIELVRQWRNSDKIRQYMEFRGEITQEMQEEWYRTINRRDNCFYFIIKSEGEDVGLINIKDIDWETHTGEWGIFIWNDDCLHTGISYRAALCLHDFLFKILRLKTIKAHVLNTNPRSIKYNQKIGYVSLENLTYNEEHNDLYLLTKETYMENRIKIISFLKEKYNFTSPTDLYPTV